eukprot:scaffold2534_cov260-Pinguiococcus_pyrenoidosus.AAC.30
MIQFPLSPPTLRHFLCFVARNFFPSRFEITHAGVTPGSLSSTPPSTQAERVFPHAVALFALSKRSRDSKMPPRSCCYLDVSIGGSDAGRMTFEVGSPGVFSSQSATAPVLSRHFRLPV